MDSFAPSVVATLRFYNTGSGGFCKLKRQVRGLARAQSLGIGENDVPFARNRSRWLLTSLVTQENEPVSIVQSHSAIRYTGAVVDRGVLGTGEVFKIAKA